MIYYGATGVYGNRVEKSLRLLTRRKRFVGWERLAAWKLSTTKGTGGL